MNFEIQIKSNSVCYEILSRARFNFLSNECVGVNDSSIILVLLFLDVIVKCQEEIINCILKCDGRFIVCYNVNFRKLGFKILK